MHIAMALCPDTSNSFAYSLAYLGYRSKVTCPYFSPISNMPHVIEINKQVDDKVHQPTDIEDETQDANKTLRS
jgi:hypothetical protein